MFSFNLIVGGPGTGKTTLAQQVVFANASPARRALYFTVLGEPPIKMLRYQQTYSFFNPSRVDGIIRFVNLSQVVQEIALMRTLGRLGEAPAETLLQDTGLRRQALNTALDRLVALHYAIRIGEAGREVYRPVVRVLGT